MCVTVGGDFEFVVGFTRNFQIVLPIELTLFVSTTEPVPVPFKVETMLGIVFTGNATNNSTTVVYLYNSYQVQNSSDRNKGIRIYSNKEVTVYGLNYRYGTSDAFLALQCSTLRLEEYVYYGLAYNYGGYQNSQLLFVACEDNTVINIASQTILLNKTETFLFANGSDLTGTVAVSNKPVSFFSGHQCSPVPSNVRNCDHLMEQLPDTSTWGTHFLSASFAGRDSGEIYRVIASEPSTTVTFTCSSVSQPKAYTLRFAGSWEEITTSDDSFCLIVSNKPILVVQFALGIEADGYGDPFMTVVPAINQYSNNYVIPIFRQFPTNFITIFVSPEHYQPQDIHVDGVNLEDSNWTAIYCLNNTTCGYSTYIDLAAGNHQIYHQNKTATIGVIAYGFDRTFSYGYPGGLKQAIMEGTVISLLTLFVYIYRNKNQCKCIS